MPNTREKLIGVLDDLPVDDEWYGNEEIADHLLANGVTIQKWIPVTERLPDRNDMVIAYYPTMCCTSGEMQIHKAWAMSDTCTHWMPLPEAPKGE